MAAEPDGRRFNPKTGVQRPPAVQHTRRFSPKAPARRSAAAIGSPAGTVPPRTDALVRAGAADQPGRAAVVRPRGAVVVAAPAGLPIRSWAPRRPRRSATAPL